MFPWVRDPYLEEVVHQEAAKVDREGTNRSKALGVSGLFQQFSESAGQNASKCRAGPENVSCGSRPNAAMGKAAVDQAERNRAWSVPPG